MLKQNEKGSTLIIVLLIVVVITILGAALFTMNMSASKQFTNKEEQVQARHLAEMGVVHYKEEAAEQVEKEKFIKEYDNEGNYLEELSKKNYKENVCKAAQLVPIEIKNEEGGEYISEEIGEKIEGEERQKINCNSVESDAEDITLYIKSTGLINETEKEIEAEIKIKPISSTDNNENNEGGDEGIGGNDGDVIIEGGDYTPPSYSINNIDNSKLTIYVGRDYKGRNATHLGAGRNSVTNLYINRNFEDMGGSSNFANELNSTVNIIVKGDYITNIGAYIGKVSSSKACIVVHGDYIHDLTYAFTEPNVGDNSLFYVMGEIKERAYLTNKITTKTEYGKGHKFGNPNINCPIDFPNDPESPSTDDSKWIVQPEVEPDYFPERNKNS